jgi:hypothetical protein
MSKSSKKSQHPDFWDILHGDLPPLEEGKWFTTGKRVVFRLRPISGVTNNNETHPKEGKHGVILPSKSGLVGFYEVLFDGEQESYTCTGAELFEEPKIESTTEPGQRKI